MAYVPGYVDIHAHVLPGVDDGPPDLDAAIEMARTATEAGTAVLAATPHLSADFPAVRVDELAARCEELRGALTDAGIILRLVLGAEVSLVWALEATDDELALATYGQRGTDVLIETPRRSIAGLGRLLYSLSSRGVRITLAHPEQNPDFQRNPAMLEELVGEGVLLQVNAESLLGPSRRSPASRLGRELCQRGIAHAIASDGHRAASWRPVGRLAEAARAAESLVGREQAGWMLAAAPAAIVAGVEPPERPLLPATRRRTPRLPRFWGANASS